jgi:hypothetical protein
MRLKALAVLALALTGLAATPLAAQPMSMEQFRAELVGVPLCGTPASGAFEGKALCVVHLPDGTVIVAGAGILTRGIWEPEGEKVCRRNKEDALERRRCVTYERTAAGYKNSDGVEACIGPCAK